MTRSVLCLICVAFASIGVGAGAAPIHDAVPAEKLDVVKQLVQADPTVAFLQDHAVKIDAATKSSSTPLHPAAFRRDLDLVTTLLKLKADTGSKNKQGADAVGDCPQAERQEDRSRTAEARRERMMSRRKSAMQRVNFPMVTAATGVEFV